MKSIAKVMVRAGAYYVLSRKRAPGKIKDHRLEHLGGHLKRGEQPLEALIREVGEEEKTGGLAREVERLKPEPRLVEVGGPGGQLHYLYEVSVDEALARNFKADPGESYGFDLVKAEDLDTDEGLVSFSAELTPKTLAIYRALGRPV